MKRKCLAFTLVLVLLLALMPGAALADGAADYTFVIKDGVLVDCEGTGEELIIPEGVVRVETGAFRTNTLERVTKVVFPEGLEELGDNVLYSDAYYKKLKFKDVVFPSTLKKVGFFILDPSSFTEEDFVPGQHIAVVGDEVLIAYAAPDKFSDIYTRIIPGGIKYIAGGAMYWNRRYIADLTLHSGVKELHSQSLWVEPLNRVTLPSTITYIDDDPFGKNNLGQWIGDSTTVAAPEGSYALEWAKEKGIKTEALEADGFHQNEQHPTWLKVYLGPGGEITVPERFQTIEETAFEGCSNITKITIPSNVRWGTNSSCVIGCSNLNTVVIKDGINYLDRESFVDCPKLKDVYLPASITGIAPDAFVNCSPNLRIHAGAGTYAEKWAKENGCTFVEDESIHYVDWKSMGCEVDSRGVLTRYTGSGGELIFPDDCGLTAIADGAFRENSSLKRVVLPDGLTSIGEEAFGRCSALESVTLPDSVTAIGYQAFYGCKNLKSINLPKGLTQISDGLFWLCSSLENIDIPDGVTVIGERAFQACERLKRMDVPDSVTDIGGWAFTGCSALTDLTLPDTLNSLGSSAFTSSGITQITIPAGPTDLQGGLTWCANLKQVTLPNTITTLRRGVVDGCKALESMNIPASVVEFVGAGDSVFADASRKLTLHVVPGSLGESYVKEVGAKYIADQPYVPAQAAYASTQNVQVDGKTVEFQMYALKDLAGNDTNYVKIRDVAAALDGTAAQFNVGWDNAVNIETGKGYTTRNGQENQTPYSGDRAYQPNTAATKVNGNVASLEAFVLLDDNGNGSTYYKLRDLGKALGFNVGWSAQRGVFVETDKPYNANG